MTAKLQRASAQPTRLASVSSLDEHRARKEAEPERWVTKKQLASHLGVTPRWIEQQQQLGLPHLHMGGINRYRISEVEEWLRDRYTPATAEAA